MEFGQKSPIAAACRKALRCLALLLLNCGMTWKEFSEMLKFVVPAATEHYGIKDRPANASQVSNVIDIDRKNVKRQHELLVAEM